MLAGCAAEPLAAYSWNSEPSGVLKRSKSWFFPRFDYFLAVTP